MTALLVVAGAAFGAPARLLVSRALLRPRGTLLVNVVGSLLLGLFAGLGTAPYALLGIGFCGAFTTFSTFAVETVTMPRRPATTYVLASVVLCTLACAAGLALALALA